LDSKSKESVKPNPSQRAPRESETTPPLSPQITFLSISKSLSVSFLDQLVGQPMFLLSGFSCMTTRDQKQRIKMEVPLIIKYTKPRESLLSTTYHTIPSIRSFPLILLSHIEVIS